jgi:hypothetical protein
MERPHQRSVISASAHLQGPKVQGKHSDASHKGVVTFTSACKSCP